MPIGSSLGITLPTQGGNSNTWGTDLNTELQKIIDACEAQVPASAIDFSADLDFENVAAVDLAHTSYRAQGSAPSELRSIYFDSSGDLYIRNGSNSTVQITSGSSLSGAGGDITGAGYGTSGVELNWDGTQFKFKDASGTHAYADVYMSTLILRDTAGNGLTFSVGTLGSDYSLAWPTSVASGATTILQSDASGNLSYSNTFSTDITMSGSAEVKHGSRTVIIPATAGVGQTSAEAYIGFDVTNGGLWDCNAATDQFVIPLKFKTGDRLTSIKIWYEDGSTGTDDFYLREFVQSTQTVTTHETVSNAAASAGHTSTTMTVDPNITIAAGSNYYVEWSPAAGGVYIAGIEVTYDRP